MLWLKVTVSFFLGHPVQLLSNQWTAILDGKTYLIWHVLLPLCITGYGTVSSVNRAQTLTMSVKGGAASLVTGFMKVWKVSYKPTLKMWHDQEEWVGCRRCCFWDIGKSSVQILLFHIVFSQVLHNSVTRYPIVLGFALKWSISKF